GGSYINVRDEQPWFTVWLVAEQRPIRPHHRRSSRRAGAGKVYGCEIAGVLGGAAQGGLLMDRVLRIGETRRLITAGLGLVEMRVEHDVRALPDGPANSFGITPALMADRDTKHQGTGLE